MADRAKIRQNAIDGFTRMLKSSPAWDRSHSRASTVLAAPSGMTVDGFVKALEEAMHEGFPDNAKYQAQFRELVGHMMKRPSTPTASCFLFEVAQLNPKIVATLPPSRMGSIAEIIKAEEAQRELDELGHISAENSKTAGVQCPKCGKVDLSRLNLNRSGLDDERFGKQYETNMDVEDTCQCRVMSAEERERQEREEAERKAVELAAAKVAATSGNFLMPDVVVAAGGQSPALKPAASPEKEKRPTAGQKRSRSNSKKDE